MTAFTKLDPQPGLRDPNKLVKYSYAERLNLNLMHGEPDPYSEIAPGLYPDEVAYLLDTGEKVAVSVEKDWQGNITGFHAYARWIEDDGSTKLFEGTPIEVSWGFSLSTSEVNTHGADEIMKDCYRMLLGEPQQLEVTTGVKLIELDTESHNNASVRVHIAAVANLGTSLTVDL